MITIYNKLVRDLIPQIIEQAGKTCRTRTLSPQEYSQSLKAKLREEAEEYLASGSLEELTDILVVYAIAKLNGIDQESLKELRLEKARNRGGFEHKIFLESVE